MKWYSLDHPVSALAKSLFAALVSFECEFVDGGLWLLGLFLPISVRPCIYMAAIATAAHCASLLFTIGMALDRFLMLRYPVWFFKVKDGNTCCSDH